MPTSVNAGVERDGAHAFYLGAELQKAEIAFALGKRYVQDRPLDWCCAVTRAADDLSGWCAPGSTRQPAPPAADRSDTVVPDTNL